MSAPDATARFTEALPLPLKDEDGPVFSEPWQAQAFAMAIQLHQAGAFTWGEWAQTLGTVLAEAARDDAAAGRVDDGSRYYAHWLAALERLVAANGLVPPETLHRRKEEWTQAYLRTPHGKPVVL